MLARDRTDSFTGAELEGAVKSAASFAVERVMKLNSGQDDFDDFDSGGDGWDNDVAGGGGEGRGLHSLPFELVLSSSVHRLTQLKS